VIAAVLAELLLEDGSTAVLQENVNITAINTKRDKSAFFMNWNFVFLEISFIIQS
jgi:hypothetical protein